MNRQEKTDVVAELQDTLGKVACLIVADYRGLTVEQVNGLRSEIRKGHSRCPDSPAGRRAGRRASSEWRESTQPKRPRLAHKRCLAIALGCRGVGRVLSGECLLCNTLRLRGRRQVGIYAAIL